MKLKNVSGAIAIGVGANFVAIGLIFPLYIFLVLDIVAGTNLSASQPVVWQRVSGNLIFMLAAVAIGFITEVVAGCWVTKVNFPNSYLPAVWTALSIVISTFIFKYGSYPVWFEVLIILRVLAACGLGAYWCKRRMNKSPHSSQDVAPIAPPY